MLSSLILKKKIVVFRPSLLYWNWKRWLGEIKFWSILWNKAHWIWQNTNNYRYFLFPVSTCDSGSLKHWTCYNREPWIRFLLCNTKFTWLIYLLGSFLLIEWPNSKFSLAYDSMICIRPTGKFPLLIWTYGSTVQTAKRPKLCPVVVWEALEISTESNKWHWAQGRGHVYIHMFGYIFLLYEI